MKANDQQTVPFMNVNVVIYKGNRFSGYRREETYKIIKEYFEFHVLNGLIQATFPRKGSGDYPQRFGEIPINLSYGIRGRLPIKDETLEVFIGFDLKGPEVDTLLCSDVEKKINSYLSALHPNPKSKKTLVDYAKNSRIFCIDCG